MQRFNDGGGVTDSGAVTNPFDSGIEGKPVGQVNSLSTWAGPYVTEMLGRGQAIANDPYQAYMGPLTAGESNLQQQAFQGVASLAVPTEQMGGFTPQMFTADTAQQYMNPYLQSALQPQIDEARRQADIQRIQDAGRLTKAGAYGGSRQAVMESEGNRALLQNLANITGQGYASAFNQAANQFNTEQGRMQAAQDAANRFGLDALTAQTNLGGIQRGIEQEGIAADYAQFREERDYPYRQTTYMQSLLQGLPIETMGTSYATPSDASQLVRGLGGILSLFTGGQNTTNPETTTPAAGAGG